MCIFGYLSKAHLDQAVPTGDVAAKVALFDEKIKTERDNVETARTALKQMDEQVNARLSRSDDEKGAERAVQIRRQQQAERGRLQKDIAESQARIAKLNEERAPIAAELRKVEAEVGPIKYVAALLYGDNPDSNLLERAVRWMIIIIVLVFDPLAVILLLASQYSFAWFRKIEETNSNDSMRDEYDFSNGKKGPVIEKDPEPSNDNDFNVNPVWPFPVQTPTYTVITTETPVEETSKTTESVEEPKEQSLSTETEPLPVEEPLENPVSEQPSELVEEEPKKDHGHYIGLDLDQDESTNEQEEKIIDEAHAREKEAMKKWKSENPDDSLKHQRVLLERGMISELPWEKYIEEISEEDEAAAEAAKWAQEQLDKKKDSKKKDSPMDGERGQGTDSEDLGEVTYKQNAEQNKSTLWQRIKDLKNDR
jgi:hypothetical protein